MDLQDYDLSQEMNVNRMSSMEILKDPGGKETDYICGQNLLQPEYMRDTNNFIIDLMENPISFSSSKASSSHNNSELNFPNSLFQFVNGDQNDKSSDDVVVIQSSNSANVIHISDSSSTGVNGTSGVQEAHRSMQMTDINSINSIGMYGEKAGPTGLIDLSSEMLQETEAAVNKSTYSLRSTSNENPTNLGVEQPSYASLILLRETDDDHTAMVQDNDVMYTRSISSKKVLPHKKRISRKLKVSHNADVMSLDLQDRVPEHRPSFVCELCTHSSTSQIEFFTHLKQHYEPQSGLNTQQKVLPTINGFEDVDTRLGTHQNPQNSEQQTIQHSNSTMNSTNAVEQVFSNVQLGFDDFHNSNGNANNNATGVALPTINGNTHGNDDMHILSATEVNKCMNFSTQTIATPLKDIVNEDMEFSDTEDMLEGIRNVVDKVSIEDTCDDIDLIGANGMRESWFTNNNFSIMGSPLKALKDVSFTGAFSNILDDVEVDRTMGTNAEMEHKIHDHIRPVLRVADPRKLFPFPLVFDNEPNDLSITANSSLGKNLNSQSSIVEQIVTEATSGAVATVTTTSYVELGSFQSEPFASEPSDLSKKISSSTSPLDFTNGSKTNLENLSCKFEENFVQKQEAQITSNGVEEEEDEKNDGEEEEGSNNILDDDFAEPDLELDSEHNGIDDESETTNHSADLTNPSGDCSSQSNEANVKKKSPKKKEAKVFKCNKCNRELNSSNALKYHLQTHTGLRPFTCHICNRSFFAQSALKMHLLIHTGEKAFECEFCKMRFKTRGDLKYHILSLHTEEKSFQCEFCGKNFSRKYSLDLHRKIHTKTENYKCQICGKAYRAGNYLKNHLRIHTGEKPYSCKICGKSFRISSDLSRHCKIHARKDENPTTTKQQSPNNRKSKENISQQIIITTGSCENPNEKSKSSKLKINKKSSANNNNNNNNNNKKETDIH